MADWLVMLLLAGVLIAGAVTDVKTGKVFNWLTYPAILGGWLLAAGLGAAGVGHPAATDGALDALLQSLLATAGGLIGFGVIRMAGGLGWGDVKLMGAYGAIVASWQCLFSAAVYTFIVAAAIAVVVMIRRGLVRQTMSRLLGVALTSVARAAPNLPDDSPRIPFAVAVCVGGLLAAGEYLLGWQTPWRPDWY